MAYRILLIKSNLKFALYKKIRSLVGPCLEIQIAYLLFAYLCVTSFEISISFAAILSHWGLLLNSDRILPVRIHKNKRGL